MLFHQWIFSLLILISYWTLVSGVHFICLTLFLILQATIIMSLAAHILFLTPVSCVANWLFLMLSSPVDLYQSLQQSGCFAPDLPPLCEAQVLLCHNDQTATSSG